MRYRRSWQGVLAVLLLLATGTWLARPAGAEEPVPSALPPGDAGPPVELAVRVHLPAGDGPFPAVVLMHGCSGWHGGNQGDWSEWFRARGYLALEVDGLAPRGVEEVCTDVWKVAPKVRAMDAQGALAWLAKRPDVDADRVVLMGFSHGASTTLVASGAGFARQQLAADTPRFAAGVALYPHCGALPSESDGEPRFPLAVVIGEADDWTPAFYCRGVVRRSAGGRPVALLSIPGATHSFDMFSWRGESLGAREYLGHKLVPDQAATREAREFVGAFLDEVIGQ